MRKIAIVVCWIGRLPDYFPLWKKSCAANPTVDFLFFTDQKCEDLPDNFQLHSVSLPDIAAMARKNLAVDDLILDKPYKLCDYKVMYGEIFQEYLKDYDFWGYCDMDMLMGDIRKFFPDELLDSYDKLLTYGHLSLYRNTPEVNQRYKAPGGKFDAHEVMHSSLNFAFDEWNGIFSIYKYNNFSMFEKVYGASVSWLHRRFSLVRRTSKKYQAPASDYKYQVFYYENGTVMRAFLDDDGTIKSDEFLYIHMMKRKFPGITAEIAAADAVYCTPGGFVIKQPGTNPDLALIKKLNPFRGTLYEKVELYIRRKIMKHRNHKVFVRKKRH